MNDTLRLSYRERETDTLRLLTSHIGKTPSSGGKHKSDDYKQHFPLRGTPKRI